MTKFDPETREKFLEAINVGASYQIACDYAGIDHKTFHRWMVRGLKEREEDTEYSRFRQDVKKRSGKAAVGWLKVIDNAMPDQWQAAAWKLERRHFSEYSANPLVREEMKYITKELKKLKKQQGGNTHGEEAKEMDSEGNQASRSTPPGATCT